MPSNGICHDHLLKKKLSPATTAKIRYYRFLSPAQLIEQTRWVYPYFLRMFVSCANLHAFLTICTTDMLIPGYSKFPPSKNSFFLITTEMLLKAFS